MKKLLFVQSFLLAILLFSCKNTEEPKAPEQIVVDTKPFIGSYVGLFGENKINVTILTMFDGKIDGKSIVAGNERRFSGSYVVVNGGVHVVANEPGDDKNDGVFEFDLSVNNPNSLTGNWKGNSNGSNKNYSLLRKDFVYDEKNGIYSELSTRKMEIDELYNDYLEKELRIMRNEIFARHGMAFKSKDLRKIFEKYDWYVPMKKDVTDELTPVEKHNLSLIKQVEEMYLPGC